MKSILATALFLCFLCLCGCGRSTPTNYYLLESSLAPVQAENLPSTSLRVAMVEGPAYLNRNNIVSRVQNESRVILAEFHLWAEPLTSGVRRVLSETISRPLLDQGINVLPIGTESGGDYVLLVDLQRLDGNFNQKAVLESQWALLDKNDKPLHRGIFSAGEMVNGADYNALVAAESRLVSKFGEYLGRNLPGIMLAKKYRPAKRSD